MKKIAYILLFICIGFVSQAQDNNIFIRAENNPELKVTITGYFGISLLTQYDSFIRYAFIQIKMPSGEQKITYLSKEQFMAQITGKMTSKANPDKVNFLELYKIDPESFENLWKLRYSQFPYDGPNANEKGWAGLEFAPTPAQWAFLRKNYGYSSFEQLLYGEKMWELVKDSQAQAWQAQYKSLK
jgi:hypothetical protein